MTYYLERQLLVYVPSTKRLQLIGSASNNLHQKLPPMVLNSCPEEKSVKRLSIIDHTFDTWASQYTTWITYGETTRVWSIAQQYLTPSYTKDTTYYRFTSFEAWSPEVISICYTLRPNTTLLIYWLSIRATKVYTMNWSNQSSITKEILPLCSWMIH